MKEDAALSSAVRVFSANAAVQQGPMLVADEADARRLDMQLVHSQSLYHQGIVLTNCPARYKCTLAEPASGPRLTLAARFCRCMA